GQPAEQAANSTAAFWADSVLVAISDGRASVDAPAVRSQSRSSLCRVYPQDDPAPGRRTVAALAACDVLRELLCAIARHPDRDGRAVRRARPHVPSLAFARAR